MTLPPPTPEAVAARVKAERERLGLSQAEAARRSGLARSHYCRLERHADPCLSTLLALVGLGMDARALAPELNGAPAPRRRRVTTPGGD